MKQASKRGKAIVTTRGDVTTVRVVDYRRDGQRVAQAGDDLTAAGKSPPADLDTLKSIDLIAFNYNAEQAFLVMLSDLCDKMSDGVPVVGARAETAYRLNVSTETAKRYIEKYCCAFSAPFAVRQGLIYRRSQ